MELSRKNAGTIDIKFPKLTDWQQETYDWLADPYKSGKVACIKSPRQRGKTSLAAVELIAMALRHSGTSSYVFEPTLSLARKVFQSCEKSLAQTGFLTINNSQLLELGLSNGSTISFRSTEQTSRGLTVTGLLILDECAYLDEEIIFEILPLVNVHKAPILILSTPFIKEGYYYSMYELGLSGSNELVKTFDWCKYPVDERFLTKEQDELYKLSMSPQKYRTEILGEFLESGGLLFTGIDECLIHNEEKVFDKLYIGIDFASGKGGDFTVITAVNSLGEQVMMERTNSLSPMEQVDWLAGIINSLGGMATVAAVQAEVNSLGVVYIDALKKKIPYYINEWTTSNESKRVLITQLQLAFERREIGILPDYAQMNELRKYEMQINPKTKTVTFNGAKNSHDDTVMALAFAYDAYLNNYGNFSIGFA